MRERESERERRIKQDPSTGNFFNRKGDYYAIGRGEDELF